MGSKGSTFKPTRMFRSLLKHNGYSDKAIKEVWKGYNSSEKKGIVCY
jgi:hypothetical protein